ncbi:MAG TPA: hypothetical protein VKA21_09255 [Candidatus Binatia bacterium]|nr:hypothetical protein [Candidatus Binatia bacterium]
MAGALTQHGMEGSTMVGTAKSVGTMGGRGTRAGRRLAGGAIGVLLLAAGASAQPCPPGRWVVPGATLIAGVGGPVNDSIEIVESDITIGSGGCPTKKARIKGKKKFTTVAATFTKCTGIKGKVVLKAKIASPACDTMTGTVTAKKAKPKKVKFTARRVPNFVGPAGVTIGPEGGTFTNPSDGSSVTVPPGAYDPGESATFSSIVVPNSDVVAMEAALGIVPPTGLNLIKPMQVIIGAADPGPDSAVLASLPDDGFANAGGTLIHTLIEPTFVSGYFDPRATNLVFDGEVTQEGGRFSMQVSPQNFGSPPGRSCVVQIPPTMPTCFVDGVVRDSNGSPVPFAIVSNSTLSMVSRANAAGFYRQVIKAGANTMTATAPIGTGTANVNCDPNTAPRIAGVDIVIPVAANPSVPVVTITDPAMNETFDGTVRVITGTVSPPSIPAVTIVTQTGDFADAFVQTAAVNNGTFTAAVILSAGRENTIIVTATDGTLVGSDSVVITVIGTAGEDLRFTMTWDTGISGGSSATDIDLYVRTPGPNGVADAVDGVTIYYYTGGGEGGMLDIDNTSGFGPENTVFPLGAAAPGTYAFAAHYYSGTPATSVTISVFVKGMLRGSFSQVLTTADSSTGANGLTIVNPASVFNVGTVSFPGGAIGGPIPQTSFTGP